MKAIIADIQRSSVHDGPGFRTTVFFKGCPLNCKWCHNPECIEYKQQILFYPERCIGCGQCKKGCFSGAKVVCGREMSTADVLKEILIDKEYYKNGGGVTFSGGEPLAQKEFLSQIIDESKRNGIGCAVETSLIYFDKEIFNKLDLVMADIKIWDENIHKQNTGVSNKVILDNFIKLDKLDIPIIARTPVIPQIEQGINFISDFLKTLKNVKKYELLPYHPLGNSKRKALGLPSDGFSVPTEEYMKNMRKYEFIQGNKQ